MYSTTALQCTLPLHCTALPFTALHWPAVQCSAPRCEERGTSIKGVWGKLGIILDCCSAHCMQSTVYHRVNTVNYQIYCAHHTRFILQCILYTVQCAVYIVQCILYTVHCTVYTWGQLTPDQQPLGGKDQDWVNSCTLCTATDVICALCTLHSKL